MISSLKKSVLFLFLGSLISCQGRDVYNGFPISSDSDSVICKYSHISRIRLELPKEAKDGGKNKFVSREPSGTCEGDFMSSDCVVLFYDLKNVPKIMQWAATVVDSEIQKIDSSPEEAVYLQRESFGAITIHRIDYKNGSIVTTRNVDGLNLLYGDSGWVNFGTCFVNAAEAEKMKKELPQRDKEIEKPSEGTK